MKEYEDLSKGGYLFEDGQTKKIINEFTKKGYPDDSFVINWSIEPQRKLDLVVLDSQNGNLLYVFEFKYWNCDKEEFPRRMRQLIKHMKGKNYILQEICGVVKLKKTDEIIYTLINLEKGTYEETELAKIIKPIKSEQILIKNKEIQEKKKKKKNSVETLTKVSIALAVLTAIILILDIVEKIQMTNTRLLLYGAIVLLLLLPFANKVKIASIEFEKEKKTDDPRPPIQPE